MSDQDIKNSLDCIKFFTFLSLTSVERRHRRHEDLDMFDSFNFLHDYSLRGSNSNTAVLGIYETSFRPV